MVDDRMVRILRCSGAAEVIDALVAGPIAFSQLRRKAPKRVLEFSLRVLASEGALARSDAGSWDGKPRQDTIFSLTESGLAVAAALSDWHVWTAVYEQYLRDR